MTRIIIKNNLLSIYKNVMSTSLYKNFIFLVTNSFLSTILGFIFITITTRLLSATDLGIYSALLSVVGLLGLLSKLGLDIGLIRFLPQSKDSNSLINSCFIIGIFTSSLLSIIFLLGADYWASSLAYILSQPVFSFSFIGIVILTMLTGFQMNIFVSKRSTKYLIIRESINNAIKISLVIILAIFASRTSAEDLFYIYGISLLVSIYFGFILLKKVKNDYAVSFKIDLSQIKTMIKFSLGNYLSSIMGSGAQLALPILVLNNLGAENAAYFYIAWTLRNIIEVIPGAISTSLFAEGVNSPKNLLSNAKKSVITSYLFVIPIIIAVIIFGSPFLLIFGDNYAKNCYSLLVLFAVSVLFSSANQVIYNIKMVNANIKFIILYTGFSGFGLLLFSSILMPYFGLIGVGLGLVGSQGILLGIILIISQIQHHTNIPQ